MERGGRRVRLCIQTFSAGNGDKSLCESDGPRLGETLEICHFRGRGPGVERRRVPSPMQKDMGAGSAGAAVTLTHRHCGYSAPDHCRSQARLPRRISKQCCSVRRSALPKGSFAKRGASKYPTINNKRQSLVTAGTPSSPLFLADENCPPACALPVLLLF